MKFKDTKYGDLTGQYYDGDIELSKVGLSSLEGCPKYVEGVIDLAINKLTTLDFFPETVELNKGYIHLSQNPLKSLKGLPDVIDGNLMCEETDITNLEGIPSKIDGYFDGGRNDHLESLYTGKPSIEVNGYFLVSDAPKLKDPRKEIIVNQIKAREYYIKGTHFKFEDIKEEFNEYAKLNKNVQSKGFRALLGIK